MCGVVVVVVVVVVDVGTETIRHAWIMESILAVFNPFTQNPTYSKKQHKTKLTIDIKYAGW